MYPLFEVFGMLLPSYNLLLAAGVFFGLLVLFFAARRKRASLEFLADHSAVIFLTSFAFARLVEVWLHGYEMNTWLFFWQDTGFDLYGGAIGFFLALFFVTWRRGEDFLTWLDITMLAIAAGLIFYHAGTLLAGTNYGTATDLPIGITFIDPDSAILTELPVHPTQIYSAVASLLFFCIAAFVFKRTRRSGQTGAFLVLTLAISYFLIDFLRADSAVVLGYLRASQYFDLAFISLAVFLEWRVSHQVIQEMQTEPDLHHFQSTEDRDPQPH